MPKETPDFAVKNAFLMPNEDQRGFSGGLGVFVDYSTASDYQSEALTSLMQYGGFYMDHILPGGKYRFGDGSAAAPAIAFARSTGLGLYAAADNTAVMVVGSSIEAMRWLGTEVVVNEAGIAAMDLRVEGDTDINLLFVDASADKVGFGTAAPSQFVHVSGSTKTTLLDGMLRVGTATDTATQGDLVAGLTAAARFFYDQSAAVGYLYNSTNAITVQLSAVALTATVFNEDSQDIDFRVEGDTEANLIFCDASVDRVGFGTALPSQFVHIFGSTKTTLLDGMLRVGTATDTATQGDLVAGLTGAARLFYDQSVPACYWYTSVGAISAQLSQVAGTASILNEQAADIDFRVEGQTNANMLFIDASADTILFRTATNPVTTTDVNILFGNTNIWNSGANAVSRVTAYGGFANQILMRANGTQAAPTAVLSGNVVWRVQGIGYDATGGFAGTCCIIDSAATEDFTGTAKGGRLRFFSTPNGATAAILRGWFEQNGNLEQYNSAGSLVSRFSIVSTTGSIMNEQGDDIDLRIEGDTEANLFVTDASTDRVGFGTAGPSQFVHVFGSTKTTLLDGMLRVGTATDTATQGDLVAGLTGAARLFYDQSVPQLSFYSAANAEVLRVASTGAVLINGDTTGAAGFVGYTDSENTATARSTGTGTIKFADATNRDNVGFLKIMVGTTAYYTPLFAAN